MEGCTYEVVNRRFYDLAKSHFPKRHPGVEATGFLPEQRACLQHTSPAKGSRPKRAASSSLGRAPVSESQHHSRHRDPERSSRHGKRESRKRSRESPEHRASTSSAATPSSSGTSLRIHRRTRSSTSPGADVVPAADLVVPVADPVVPAADHVVPAAVPVVPEQEPEVLVVVSRPSSAQNVTGPEEIEVEVHYQPSPSPPKPVRGTRKDRQPRKLSSSPPAPESEAEPEQSEVPLTPGESEYTFMDLASFLPKLAEDEWEVILREAPRHLLVRAARERATTAREEDQPQLTLEPLPGTSTDVSLTTPATPRTTTTAQPTLTTTPSTTTTATPQLTLTTPAIPTTSSTADSPQTTAETHTDTSTAPPPLLTQATPTTSRPAMADAAHVREVVGDLRRGAGRGRMKSARTQVDFPASVLPTEGGGLLVRSGRVTISVEGPVRHLPVAPE